MEIDKQTLAKEAGSDRITDKSLWNTLSTSLEGLQGRIFTMRLFDRPTRKFLHLLLAALHYAERFVAKAYAYIPMVGELKEADQLANVCKYYDSLYGYMQTLTKLPKISILVPVYKPKLNFLSECLESCCTQLYTDWELCLVDDGSQRSEITAVFKEFAARFPQRIKWIAHQDNSHISETLNSCLSLATGDFIALLDHDDRLYPNALAEFVRYLNLHPDSDIFYSDERIIDAHGNNIGVPFYKPHWSPFFHLSVNYSTHLSFYRTSLARKIGGFRKGFEGSQDHDFMLRAVEQSLAPVVHIPFCLYQWRSHPTSTASSPDAKPYAAKAGERAVSEALERRGRKAKVVYDPKTFHYRISYVLQNRPMVSIIIPSKDQYLVLKQCLESVFCKTSYANFELIVVDNGSTEPSCIEYYDQLRRDHPGRVQVLKRAQPFNFCRQINWGRKQAKGEYLVFLNNDTEVRSSNWIEEMLQLAQFAEVGAVGCKLLYPKDASIQHAGIVLSTMHIAEHEGLLEPMESNVYCDMLNTVREVEAVTAACLMVAAKKFDRVGGMDQILFPNVYGDVDFCLKLREAHYSNLYTPFAVLNHYESKSRGKTIEDFEHFGMRQRHGLSLSWDSYHNPRLSTQGAKEPLELFQQLDVSTANYALLQRHCKQLLNHRSEQLAPALAKSD